MVREICRKYCNPVQNALHFRIHSVLHTGEQGTRARAPYFVDGRGLALRSAVSIDLRGRPIPIPVRLAPRLCPRRRSGTYPETVASCVYPAHHLPGTTSPGKQRSLAQATSVGTACPNHPVFPPASGMAPYRHPSGNNSVAVPPFLSGNSNRPLSLLYYYTCALFSTRIPHVDTLIHVHTSTCITVSSAHTDLSYPPLVSISTRCADTDKPGCIHARGPARQRRARRCACHRTSWRNASSFSHISRTISARARPLPTTRRSALPPCSVTEATRALARSAAARSSSPSRTCGNPA